jgi:hypothetical protein
MKLAWVMLCALLVFAACPAVASAQYVERWSGFMSLGATSLVPRNVGDIDGDYLPDLVGSIDTGGQAWAVQVRDPITGAVKFTSTTTSPGGWTIYFMDLDGNLIDDAILAYDSGQFSIPKVLVIGYGGAVAAPANGSQAVREMLLPARPNPFGSQVSLSYSLTAPGRADLEVYDVAGRMVRRLGGDRMEAGEHQVVWDGRDQGGRTLEPGMYFYRLNVDGRASEARKAVRLGQ